ncbi:MAG: hypothetical protein BWX80_01465 [Candidatus Hydrogenedentes bacterium ADurb.Bin101]|jgi:hypothetical protein|nr:MAG: hypothetical protein BWX80_01465 [Candidatus Hydrogenedentes bacterium ADurb.Bin101]
MDTDPILREVHQMKDLFARSMGYDLSRMCERLREDAEKHPERMVYPPSQTAAPVKRRTVTRKTAK